MEGLIQHPHSKSQHIKFNTINYNYLLVQFHMKPLIDTNNISNTIICHYKYRDNDYAINM